MYAFDDFVPIRSYLLLFIDKEIIILDGLFVLVTVRMSYF